MKPIIIFKGDAKPTKTDFSTDALCEDRKVQQLCACACMKP